MTELRITPVGTCRVTTPLRRASKRRRIALNLSRSYGFVHTSREAVQQARFLAGDFTVPDELQPLIMRPNLVPGWDEAPHEPSDLYFVEISSLKDVTVDGVSIQLNYATRHFRDFFSDAERTRRYWATSRENQIAERQSWLVEVESFRRMSAEDRSLLGAMQQRILTEADIESDMQTLIESFGRDKIVFVSHVNALTPDNEPIRSRVRLSDYVREIARRNDARFYDPTPLMFSVGQSVAMERDGLDLTHFTPIFCDRLFDDWQATILVDLGRSVRLDVDEGASQELGLAIARVQTALDADSIAEASRLAWAARRQLGDHPELSRLQGAIHFQLGDYEASIDAIEAVRSEQGVNEDDELLLMRAHFELGRHELAWSTCKALMSDELESSEILRVGAVCTRELGLTFESIALWEQLLGDADVASEAIVNLVELAQTDEDRDRWARRGIELASDVDRHFAALWARFAEVSDFDAMREMVERSDSLPNDVLLKLASDTADSGRVVPSAWLVRRAIDGASNDADPRTTGARAWAARCGPSWLERGLALLDRGETVEAIEPIEAGAQLSPNQNKARSARRKLDRALRIDVRAAFKAGEHARVVETVERAHRNHVFFDESDLFLGRAAQRLGDARVAHAALGRAAREPDASVRTLVLFARASVEVEAYRDALSTYRGVIERTRPEASDFDEATRALRKLPARAIRCARESAEAGDEHGAWLLLTELEAIDGAADKAGAAKRRILAQLRRTFRDLEPDDEIGRAEVAGRILALDPLEPSGLKHAAIAAMRLNRFDEALEFWLQLREIDENRDGIDRNIQKCRTWVERRARSGKKPSTPRPAVTTRRAPSPAPNAQSVTP